MPLNPNIITSIRPAKLPDLGVNMARQQQMMANMMTMEKMRREADVVAGIRNAMASPGFDPSNPESLRSIISLGPEGAEVAKQLMGAQKLGGDLREQTQAFGIKNTELLGAGMVNLMADPSNAALDYTEQKFKAAGFSPETYKPTLDLLRQLPDANARKQAVTQLAAGSTLGQSAMKALGINLKEVKVGDQVVMLDDNPNSPTFNQEISRFTPSAKPVELKQQVVDNTLFNVNPYTGVAAEATPGDVFAGRTPPSQTITRTDTGVVSPYSAGPVTPVRMQAPAVSAPVTEAPQVAAPGVGASVQPTAQAPGTFTPEDQARATDIVKSAAKTGRISADDAAFMRGVQGPDGAAAFDEWTKTNRIRVGGGVPAPRQPSTKTPVSRQAPAVRQSAPRTTAPPMQAPAKPLTISEQQKQKAFRAIMPIIGYNEKTGSNRVSGLINQSTSGAVEMYAANALGALRGKATPGQVALGELQAIADNMTFEKLRGKLGAQISDADVRLIANTMANIADGSTPANKRAAAWNNVVLPLLVKGAGYAQPSAPPATATKQRKALADHIPGRR